jgi:hypothetical protein
MQRFMAPGTQGNQIQFVVGALLTPQQHMVDLQVLS